MNNVLVKFDENTTTLVLSEQNNIKLEIGYQMIINQYIKASLPTPYETENIIMIIEDEITRIYTKLPTIEKLTSNNPQIKMMANFLLSDKYITTEQVELLFNQFFDVITGAPKQKRQLDSLPFIVILIILRELLHHLNIEGVTVI